MDKAIESHVAREQHRCNKSSKKHVPNTRKETGADKNIYMNKEETIKRDLEGQLLNIAKTPNVRRQRYNKGPLNKR